MHCHLHFDHCGGNPRLGGRPILVQEVELATAHRGDHTIDELVDLPGAVYEGLAGETEIWPDVWIIPTPGHQSLVLRQVAGTVIFAGQAHDFASQFASDQLARQAALHGVEQPLPPGEHWKRGRGPVKKG